MGRIPHLPPGHRDADNVAGGLLFASVLFASVLFFACICGLATCLVLFIECYR